MAHLNGPRGHDICNSRFAALFLSRQTFSIWRRREPRAATINHRHFTDAINSQIMKCALANLKSDFQPSYLDIQSQLLPRPSPARSNQIFTPASQFQRYNLLTENAFFSNPDAGPSGEQRERKTRPTFVNNVECVFLCGLIYMASGIPHLINKRRAAGGGAGSEQLARRRPSSIDFGRARIPRETRSSHGLGCSRFNRNSIFRPPWQIEMS
ncbi:hypothetical protein EVAR_96053_1 [Eumeta japonica]|uniref:Uncharacterized protein n=1 Tax=Eumeta variegata TaxID=151549 RepID=A0A4C1W6W3_EUMVA|nr:hypothetical protein EVAR_96053_1 [Eumeta japonica]